MKMDVNVQRRAKKFALGCVIPPPGRCVGGVRPTWDTQTGIATSLLCTIHPCNGPEAMSRTSRSNGVEQRGAEGEEDAGPGSLVIGVTGVGLETQVRYSLNSTEISWNDGL